MSDFATVLRTEIVTRKATRRSARLLKIIDAKPSKRRTRILARLEAHAAVAAGGEVGKIDWSAIDWTKLFNVLIELLLKLLPLLI